MLLTLVASAVLILLFVLGVDRYLLRGPDMMPALNGDLSEAQTKAVDLLVDLTKLVITVALGVLGLLSYYIKGEAAGKLHAPLQVVMIFLSSCFGMASVYFGHRVISTLVEMLANDYFAVTSFAVAGAVVLQYTFLCGSVLCAVIFVVLRHAPALVTPASAEQGTGVPADPR